MFSGSTLEWTQGCHSAWVRMSNGEGLERSVLTDCYTNKLAYKIQIVWTLITAEHNHRSIRYRVLLRFAASGQIESDVQSVALENSDGVKVSPFLMLTFHKLQDWIPTEAVLQSRLKNLNNRPALTKEALKTFRRYIYIYILLSVLSAWLHLTRLIS